MSLLNNLKRYLYGTPGMTSIDTGDVSATGQGSQGLIGTGGESGGGLLQDSFSKMNNVEGGLLSNIPEGALLGAALYGQGMKGKDPLAGAFPAVTQAAQLKNLLKPRTELQKNLEAAGYKPGTPEYKAALNAYLNKGKQNTLSKEALALYKEGQVAPDFDKWFEGLNKVEKDLYNKQIRPNLSTLEASFEFIKQREKELLNSSPPIPIDPNDSSKPDLSKIKTGDIFNNEGQLVVFDGKRFVSFQQYNMNK